MDNLILTLLFYYATLYIIFIVIILKGYSKTFLEIVLTIFPMFFLLKSIMSEPCNVFAFLAIEYVTMNVLLLLNVILVKKFSFLILVSIVNNGIISKFLRKFFNKKDIAREARRLLDIEYGPKLKFGIPAMAGKKDKKTKVKFDRKGFPKFKSFYTIYIERPDYRKSREYHFYYANKKLYRKAIKNQKIRKLFTKAEMQELKEGETPRRYTWHHHQDKGKLQLVSRKIHMKVFHIGGYSLWGGEK